MTKRYYDVKLTIHVNGFDKDTTNRVFSDSLTEAIIDAINDEVHSIDEFEVRKRVQFCVDNDIAVSVNDTDDFIYILKEVIELTKVTLPKYNSTESITVLLPAYPDKINNYTDYFVQG